MAHPAHYTDAQRKAIAQAVLDAGLSVPAAMREAAAGRLPGIGAFDMKKDAAYNAVNAERDRRNEAEQERANADPLQVIPDTARRLLKISVKHAHELETAANKGEYKADEIRDVTRNLQDLHKLLRYADKTSPGYMGKDKRPQAEPGADPPTNLASLLNDTTNTNSTQNTQTPTPPTGHEAGSSSRDAARPAREPVPAA